MMKARDFAALNVTIPYKKTVMPYLDEVDERARRIGAVNTIVNDHGRLIGRNTDYYGFWFMLEQAGIAIQGRRSSCWATAGRPFRRCWRIWARPRWSRSNAVRPRNADI